MRQAREDKKPLVYIGFGSITVPNPQTMTEHIFQAVQKSGFPLLKFLVFGNGSRGRVVRRCARDCVQGLVEPDEQEGRAGGGGAEGVLYGM